ncbi:MAG: sulfite exporter TauE/SafE family protein [Cyanobacteria bacterium SZAS LIN-3]|nr:sulfite exporter TauE/SafE family protein [Cyanobacteria bacterium SZAS LIN-3]
MDSASFFTIFLETLSVGVVAFLYSAVGHGGATGYIAVLSLFGVGHEAISGTTLVLNCLVSGLALAAYARAGQYSHKVVLPYLILSVPCAFVGALLPVDKKLFHLILCWILPLAGLRFLIWPEIKGEDEARIKRPPTALAALIGAALGLLSGIVGIGGGVFLSPIMIMCRFATTKETAAASALFILANSLSGLAGRLYEGKLDLSGPTLWPFLLAALFGALAGSHMGANRLSSLRLKRLLGIVLVIAALKLIQGK